MFGLLLELIDTCWNVNSYQTHEVDDNGRGINRYMLECKLFQIVSVESFSEKN